MTEEIAISLREAAKRLGLSYQTVFARRKQIGFRLPGGRAWRVWPSQLALLGQKSNNVTRLSLQVDGDSPCQSAEIKYPGFGRSTSARQASRELDALLAPQKKKPRRNTTTD